jgi:hypothetical protein
MMLRNIVFNGFGFDMPAENILESQSKTLKMA